MSAIAAATLSAVPAQAADPSTRFGVFGNTDAQGTFIWHNRSVQVGGSVTANPTGSICAAVVFTAFDTNGRQVARAARPGDNSYTCSSTSYGFTLDASTVVGGIRTIRVDLWEWLRTLDGSVHRADTRTYSRP